MMLEILYAKDNSNPLILIVIIAKLRCQKYHQDENITSFGNIFPEKDELLKELTDIRKMIDNLKNDIKTIINKLNIVEENFEKLYGIYYEMINDFGEKEIMNIL